MTGSVLLILTSIDRDPAEVGSALALEPFQVWRRGERKGFSLPDGTSVQFESIHEESGWKAKLPHRHNAMSLQDQAEGWLRELTSRSLALSKLHQLGWNSELNCFCAGTAELELEPHDLIQLGQLSVRLAVFAHCPAEVDGAR